MSQTVLAIETSCDETAASVVQRLADGRFIVRSNSVASQIDLHAATGGVVPEVAARAQLEVIIPTIDQALFAAFGNQTAWQFGQGQPYLSPIDAIAVTEGPGLIGSLLVGVEVANMLSLALKKSLLPINHYEGHLLSFLPDQPNPRWPVLALTASGGHSSLYLINQPGRYELLGQTRDDAAGEAFDKAASLLGLPYPGGPAISKLAEQGDATRFSLPRPLQYDRSLDFSFAGLKTALRQQIEQLGNLDDQIRADLAASFEAAVIESLLIQLKKAATQTKPAAIAVVGGVANNRRLRHDAEQLAKTLRLPLHFPAEGLFTDNAAMIGVAALCQLERQPSQLARLAVPKARLALVAT